MTQWQMKNKNEENHFIQISVKDSVIHMIKQMKTI